MKLKTINLICFTLISALNIKQEPNQRSSLIIGSNQIVYQSTFINMFKIQADAAALKDPAGDNKSVTINSGRSLKDLIENFQKVVTNNNLIMFLSLALILFGIVMVFTGYTLLNLMLFFIGFVLCSWSSLELLFVIDSEMMFDQDWILLFIMFIGGFFGGMVAKSSSRYASIYFRVAIGWFLANMALSTSWAATTNQFLKFLVIICFALLSVGIGSSRGDRILVDGVVFFGSFALFTGLDYFVNSGFNRIYFAAFRTESINSSNEIWSMIVGFFLVAIIGAMIQSTQSSKSATRDSEV